MSTIVCTSLVRVVNKSLVPVKRVNYIYRSRYLSTLPIRTYAHTSRLLFNRHIDKNQKLASLCADIRWSSTQVGTSSKSTFDSTPPAPSSSSTFSSSQSSPSKSASDSQQPGNKSSDANASSIESDPSNTSSTTITDGKTIDAETLLKSQEEGIDLSDFTVPDAPKLNELVRIGRPIPFDYEFFPYMPRSLVCGTIIWLEDYMPSGSAIILLTCTARLLLFPLLISARRHQAQSSQIAPEFQKVMEMRKEAVAIGDDYAMMKANTKLQEIKANPHLFNWKKMIALPLTSAFVFGVLFLTLRKMGAKGHIDFREGGYFTFVDLTVPDTSYCLQSIAALGVFLQFVYATEMTNTALTGVGSSGYKFVGKIMRYVFPVILFFAAGRLPSCAGLYMATNSVISVAQSLLLRVPFVSRKLKIPPVKKDPNKPKFSLKSLRNLKSDFRGVIGEAKNMWKKWSQRKQARAYAQTIKDTYDKGSKGPIRKTFDYDPTKIRTK
ncbi:mitochondrial inner membrane protein OXA1L-like [Brevipalpus obovatus]|uniref:mitochondrial inner membrane protein OXA1L-like n=1 Tax=Brevipalpus obovatus TaxID=246614 RepID=UPI003D9F0A14